MNKNQKLVCVRTEINEKHGLLFKEFKLEIDRIYFYKTQTLGADDVIGMYEDKDMTNCLLIPFGLKEKYFKLYEEWLVDFRDKRINQILED